MNIIKCNNLQDIRVKEKDIKVLTWGKFDAMHIGHQAIMNKMMTFKGNGKTAAIVFYPGPEIYLNFEDKSRVNSLDESLEIMGNIGIDNVFVVPFNEEVANERAEIYLKSVIDGTGADTLVVGKDVSFGYNREGDDKYLTEYGQRENIDVHIEDKKTIDGQIVSSKSIKEYIKDGNMIKVSEMLGRKYCIEGQVQKGKGLGHKELYATLNLSFEDNKCIPKYGVYYSKALIKGKENIALTNIGIAPTFGGIKKPLCESFIIDFNEDIYGEKVIVSLDEFRRPEKKFDSVEELKQVIDNDLEAIKKYYNN